MTETIRSEVFCVDCDMVIEAHEKGGERAKCPKCGSLKRHFKDEVIKYITISGKTGEK